MIKKILFGLFVLSLFIAPLSTLARSEVPDEYIRERNQAQINELLRQIAALQEQIRLLQGQPTTWCHNFNANLGIGASGNELSALVTALMQELIIPVIPPSKGPVVIERFDEGMAANVSSFQLKYKNEILTPNGLVTPTGYVGPATRAKLNQLYGCRPVTGNQPPTISGVSGPTTLRVGETGTWTVQAIDPDPPAGGGTLSYSVIWGDEPMMTPVAGAPATQMAAPVQQTSTFTHTYATARTYTPIFIVNDNAYKTSRTSISVQVGERYGCYNGVCVDPPPPAPITVTSPNGGEEWYANSVRPITWTYTGATSATKVDLYLDAEPPACIYSNPACLTLEQDRITLDRNISARSTYNWIVATDITNNPILAGNYRVRVCPAGSGSTTNCDSSNNYFTILPDTITVTSPNGGEQWYTNSVRPITWTYPGAISATKVDLYLESRAGSCPPEIQDRCFPAPSQSFVLDKNISARSTYNWIVATDIVNNPISPGNYRVRVCKADSTTDCDSSDNYFTITPQTLSDWDV